MGFVYCVAKSQRKEVQCHRREASELFTEISRNGDGAGCDGSLTDLHIKFYSISIGLQLTSPQHRWVSFLLFIVLLLFVCLCVCAKACLSLLARTLLTLHHTSHYLHCCIFFRAYRQRATYACLQHSALLRKITKRV